MPGKPIPPPRNTCQKLQGRTLISASPRFQTRVISLAAPLQQAATGRAWVVDWVRYAEH
jgi:hypothetical protein